MPKEEAIELARRKAKGYDVLKRAENVFCNLGVLEILLTRCEVIQSKDGKYYIEYTGIADIPFNEEEVETLKKAGIIKNEQN